MADTVKHKADHERNTCKYRSWFFTFNNYTKEDIDLLIGYGDKYHFQEETGAEQKTQHLQGVLYFKNARSFKSIKEKFPRIHIEVLKNWKAGIAYCMKERTRSGQLFSNVVDTTIIKDPLEKWLNNLRLVQKDIIELYKTEPDERSIYWVYDEKGGIGKTSLAKHLCIKNKDCIYVSGKKSDILYAITQRIEDGKSPKMCIFDMVRSLENFVSYEAIESIKNGIFFNTKYEAKQIIYNNPHVIILANFLPDKSKLSKDRWRIWIVDDKGNYVSEE